MSAGTRPFVGATGFELSGAILHQPPPRLPERVPASLQSTILRCLAKDPRERYQDADRGSVRPRDGGNCETGASLAPRGCRRSRSVAGVCSCGCRLAATGTNAVGGARASVPAARPSIAVMQFENVAGTEDVAWMSRGVPNMLLTGLAQTRGLDIVSGQRLHEVIRQTGHDSLESLDRGQIADVARRAGASVDRRRKHRESRIGHPHRCAARRPFERPRARGRQRARHRSVRAGGSACCADPRWRRISRCRSDASCRRRLDVFP